MNTRKYPRTLNEAFGPYTSTHISDREDRYRVTDALIYGALFVVLFLFLIGAFA